MTRGFVLRAIASLSILVPPASAQDKAVGPAVSGLITDYYVTILNRQPDASGAEGSSCRRPVTFRQSQTTGS